MFITWKLTWTEEYKHYSKFFRRCIRHMARSGYPHSIKRTAIISLFLYENDNFLYQLFSKQPSKCITCNTFS